MALHELRLLDNINLPGLDRIDVYERIGGYRAMRKALVEMDQEGIVQELDGKGRARVRLGLLAATLELKDLVATGEAARPMLASSHRRPRNRTR